MEVRPGPHPIVRRIPYLTVLKSSVSVLAASKVEWEGTRNTLSTLPNMSPPVSVRMVSSLSAWSTIGVGRGGDHFLGLCEVLWAPSLAPVTLETVLSRPPLANARPPLCVVRSVSRRGEAPAPWGVGTGFRAVFAMAAVSGGGGGGGGGNGSEGSESRIRRASAAATRRQKSTLVRGGSPAVTRGGW
jgi:hypothetical protein